MGRIVSCFFFMRYRAFSVIIFLIFSFYFRSIFCLSVLIWESWLSLSGGGKKMQPLILEQWRVVASCETAPDLDQEKRTHV